MAIDKLDMIYNDLQEVKKDIKELKEFKNKVIGGAITLSCLCAWVFEVVKSMFTKG